MTEKEIAEIRRRYKGEKSGISRVRGCYVNDKREIVSEFDQSLGLMTEDESEEMLSILKKTLSGSIGKNLADIEFSNHQVLEGEQHGGLMRLRDTALDSEEDVKKLYERIIQTVSFDSSYLILLAYDSYDVFSYTKDGRKSDESSTVFSYLLCSICPVKFTRPSLGYYVNENTFRSIASNSVIGSPELGFMFPAFDNRTSNIYNALLYTRNISLNRSEFSEAVFGCDAPMPAAEQKETFDSILKETVDDDCSYDVIAGVRERVCDILEEHKENKVEEPFMLSKSVMRELLGDNGVSAEKLDKFEERYTEEFGEHARIIPTNVISTNQLAISTPDVSVKVNPDRGDLVQMKVIDGVKYILIRAEDGVEVNGVDINIK